ncbi:MAG: hypothetical protein Q4F85_03640 [Prevotella sp.]|nr:hypothetical protein [Prevotella sp.]
MEKKKYIKPEMTVIRIDGDCLILTGSNTIKNGGQNGEQSPDFWEDNLVD